MIEFLGIDEDLIAVVRANELRRAGYTFAACLPKKLGGQPDGKLGCGVVSSDVSKNDDGWLGITFCEVCRRLAGKS
jgi:hypothetical protein